MQVNTITPSRWHGKTKVVGNQPVQLQTIEFTLIKLNYLHNNPVKAGIVEKPEDYLLCNARDYNGGKGLLVIEHLTAAYTLRR
jgi:hypothetical protein